MKDDKLYEKLKEFADKAQQAREKIWNSDLFGADHDLDQLILDITNFTADRMAEESQCL